MDLLDVKIDPESGTTTLTLEADSPDELIRCVLELRDAFSDADPAQE